MRSYQRVRTPETIARAMELRSQGKLYREIGEEFGVTGAAIRNWIEDPNQTHARWAKRRKDIARAVELRAKGVTLATIASSLGVSVNTVWFWVQVYDANGQKKAVARRKVAS